MDAMVQLSATVDLVVVTCWCGMPHGIPRTLRDFQQRQHAEGQSRAVYCPLGHSHVPAGEGRVAQLERQLTAERARHDQTKSELRSRTNSLNAEKAAKARMKNRAAAGVCPCCNRTFQNLARHMKGQHPDFAKHD